MICQVAFDMWYNPYLVPGVSFICISHLNLFFGGLLGYEMKLRQIQIQHTDLIPGSVLAFLHSPPNLVSRWTWT